VSWEEVERSLAASDAEERRRTTATLAERRGSPPAAILLRALGDADWRVRREAVNAAIALAPDVQVLDTLLSALEPGDNVGLRNSAVDALAGFGVHAIGPLARTLPRLDADGRKLVVDALARGTRPEALPVLQSLLADPDANVRNATVEAIAAIGDSCAEDAIRILEVCLESKDRWEQLAALDGLNRLAAVVPWERLAPLMSDAILLPATIVAAGRSGAAEAVEPVVQQLATARGRSWEDALDALVQLTRSGDLARERAKQVVLTLGDADRARVLQCVRAEERPLAHRRLALLVAGLFGTPDVATLAVEVLDDDQLAADAEAVLGELGSACVPALVAAARAPSASLRAHAVELLAPLSGFDEDARAATWTALGDDSPHVVAAAITALAVAGDGDTLVAAAQRIVPSAPAVVHQAAHHALVALARRHPERARELARRITPDSAEAEAAVAVIEALGSPVRGSAAQDVEFLSATLSSEHSSLRRAALAALSTLGSPAALEPMAMALTDEEAEVRLAAVRGLGRLRDASGVPLGFAALSALVARGEDAELRAAAVRALGELGDERALPVLAQSVKGEPRVAVAALEALSSLPVARRIDVVAPALAHAEPDVVKAALRAVAADSEAQTVGQLARGLDHASREVRRLAAELMGRSGSVEVLGHLRGRLAIETEALVREALSKAILDVESSGGRRMTAPPPSLPRGRPGR
jgi:HEAT repeat protein